jgi:hypothetical protein
VPLPIFLVCFLFKIGELLDCELERGAICFVVFQHIKDARVFAVVQDCSEEGEELRVLCQPDVPEEEEVGSRDRDGEGEAEVVV